MAQWLQVMLSSSSSSLFLRLDRLAPSLENFPGCIHSWPPEKSQYQTMWGSLFQRQNKSQPLKREGSITLNGKNTCHCRNTLHMSKNRVPAGNSLGRILGAPWEPPPFGHCYRHCFSVTWPWRAAQRGHSVVTALIVRWHMELQSPTKELPDGPCLGPFCSFCGPGRWPLA